MVMIFTIIVLKDYIHSFIHLVEDDDDEDDDCVPKKKKKQFKSNSTV